MTENDFDDFLEEERIIALLDDLYDDKRCPLCGSWDVVIEGRCETCYECGWSKCGI